MPIERGTGVYRNYYNGREEDITDNEYQTRLENIDFDVIISDLFSNHGFSFRRIDSSATSSRDVFEIENTLNHQKIFIACYIIKNSGIRGNNRKRLQIVEDYFGLIREGQTRSENHQYLFLGVYPIDSDGNYVYALLDNDGASLDPNHTYSSLWINFEAITSTAHNGIYFAINRRNGNKYVCFRKDYWNYVRDALQNGNYADIIQNNVTYINDNGAVDRNTEVVVDDYIPSRDAVVTREGRAKVKKNQALRDISLMDAHYICALCGKEHTFYTNHNKPYFEAHHLIPCNITVQRSFTKKLDHTLNLYCLCPECHRKIHHIRDSEVNPLLEALFNERSADLSRIYNLTLQKLTDIYRGIDRTDEDNM